MQIRTEKRFSSLQDCDGDLFVRQVDLWLGKPRLEMQYSFRSFVGETMKALALFASLFLVGCSTTTAWNKPNSSSQDFYSDHGECELRIHDIPSMMVIRRNRVYDECMTGKGWTKAGSE
jgi:hypothetical protein